MIKHEIIVAEEVKQNYSVWQGTTNVSYPRGMPVINCQADLDKWNNETTFQVGDYVTFMMNGITMHQVAYNIFVIEEKVTDYDKLKRTKYGPYMPLLVRLSGLPNKNGHAPVSRWDDLRNLRKVTQTEWEKQLKPYLDSVRDHCQSPA